jgi:hypothetical protein
MKITVKEDERGQVLLSGPDGDVSIPVVFLLSKLRRLGHGELIFTARVEWKQRHVMMTGIVTSSPYQGMVIECIDESHSLSKDTITFDHVIVPQYVEVGKVACALQDGKVSLTLYFTAEDFVKLLRENGLSEIKLSEADWYWFKKHGQYQGLKQVA